MDTKEQRIALSALYYWITILAQTLPLRSGGTFVELLVGAMLTQSGFVTEAYLAINASLHWTSYYKWLEHGKWSWVALGYRLGCLLQSWFKDFPIYLVIDDKVIFRSSTKAPDSCRHHQHGKKVNRPTYILGQCWVSLAAVVNIFGRNYPFPLLARLSRSTGNSTKLTAAKTLIRVIFSAFNKGTYLLLDSWYMKGNLILYALSAGLHVVGQVRKDTALFRLPPPRTHKRGRPRKYGERYSKDDIKQILTMRTSLMLYGKVKTLKYGIVTAKARFLKGLIVQAVWVAFESTPGIYSAPRLLISTNCDMGPIDIILAYEKRWAIEPMFHQTANLWGWKETWQQTRQVLHRWVQILFLGFSLPQMIAATPWLNIGALLDLTPWRKGQPVTAGRVRLGLQKIFINMNVRNLWDQKCQKIRLC